MSAPPAPRRTNTDLESEGAFAWSGYRSPWPETVDDVYQWALRQSPTLTPDQWAALENTDPLTMDEVNDWREGASDALRFVVHDLAVRLRAVNISDPLKSKRAMLRGLGVLSADDNVTPMGRAVERERERMDAANAGVGAGGSEAA